MNSGKYHIEMAEGIMFTDTFRKINIVYPSIHPFVRPSVRHNCRYMVSSLTSYYYWTLQPADIYIYMYIYSLHIAVIYNSFGDSKTQACVLLLYIIGGACIR